MTGAPIGRGLTAALCFVALLMTGCASTPFLSGSAEGTWAFDRVETLPQAGALDDVRLVDALTQRRSVRDFGPDPITPEQFAALLWSAQGVTADWGGRTAPSAGALYALDVYAVNAEGIRHYVPDGHQAQFRESATAMTAIADAVGQDAAAAAPSLFVITGTPDRLRPKYLVRAERYTYLEAGHAAQNLLLAATALGLGGVSIGSFDQAGTVRALGLPDGEEPIYVIPIGNLPATQ